MSFQAVKRNTNFQHISEHMLGPRATAQSRALRRCLALPGAARLLQSIALVPVTAVAEDSLCRRLGGSDAISAVVKAFLMKMRKDDADKLSRF
jgi:hypothetical protein